MDQNLKEHYLKTSTYTCAGPYKDYFKSLDEG